MRETRTTLRIVVVVFLLGLVTLPACGWRRLAIERHQKTQEIKDLEIQRRQLELDCLRRKEADPRVDCSQFQQSAAPNPATAPPVSPGLASPAPASPIPGNVAPASPAPAPPAPEAPTPTRPAQ
jgi:hypothetical protein